MSTRSRRHVTIFACLAVATIALGALALVTALSNSHGVARAGAGGKSSSEVTSRAPASGTSPWTVIGGVGGSIGAIGTFAQGVAAFRKPPAAPAPAQQPPAAG